MAYFDEETVKKGIEHRKSKDVSELLFEKKDCTFGRKRFSVRVPRERFATMIFNSPAAGDA